MGTQREERSCDDGEEDEANELLECYAHGFWNCVLEVMPVVAENAAEEDGQEVSALHHQDGSPDLSYKKTDYDGEEAAVHSPHDPALDGETKVPLCSDSRVPGDCYSA